VSTETEATLLQYSQRLYACTRLRRRDQLSRTIGKSWHARIEHTAYYKQHVILFMPLHALTCFGFAVTPRSRKACIRFGFVDYSTKNPNRIQGGDTGDDTLVRLCAPAWSLYRKRPTGCRCLHVLGSYPHCHKPRRVTQCPYLRFLKFGSLDLPAGALVSRDRK